MVKTDLSNFSNGNVILLPGTISQLLNRQSYWLIRHWLHKGCAMHIDDIGTQITKHICIRCTANYYNSMI